MNSDVLRAREILAFNAVQSLDLLRRKAQGEPIENDPQALTDGIEQAIEFLMRVPDAVLD